MGYSGKVAERQRARELRAQSWTLDDIAGELGVSKSSVSVWVRDVAFTPRPRNRGHPAMKPHPLHVAKLAEIERCDREAVEQVGRLTIREFLLAGAVLYAGEGFKRDSHLGMANTDPNILLMFVTWLRRCFHIEEPRFRVRMFLHEGLDLETAEAYWSSWLGIPRSQFRQAHRPLADGTRRRAKHVYGCPAVMYASSTEHRRVMGLVRAIVSNNAFPG